MLGEWRLVLVLAFGGIEGERQRILCRLFSDADIGRSRDGQTEAMSSIAEL